jgi:hypothetical protein
MLRTLPFLLSLHGVLL